jgi:hypothetical protein
MTSEVWPPLLCCRGSEITSLDLCVHIWCGRLGANASFSSLVQRLVSLSPMSSNPGDDFTVVASTFDVVRRSDAASSFSQARHRRVHEEDDIDFL